MSEQWRAAVARVRFDILKAQHSVVDKEWSWGVVETDPFSRLYGVDGGRGEVTCRGRRLELRPGYLYLIAAGEPFMHHPSPGLSHHWIHFAATGDGLLDLFGQVRCPLERRAADGDVERMRRLVAAAGSGTAADALLAHGLLRVLLATFFAAPNCQWPRPRHDDERFADVLRYISEHLPAPISVADLAARAHRHPTYFANLFSRRFGVGPRRYVLNKRLERAQWMLLDTDESIKVIAATTGFKDVCYFTRAFRRHVGMPPGAYRQRRERIHGA